jgi:multiple sugar transport system substrate-binding protein
MNLKNPKTVKTLLIAVGGILVLFLIILVIVLMTRDSDAPRTPTTGSSGEKIELTYWGLWEPESIMAPLIAEYESANTHVKINYTQRSFTDEDYDATLHTRLEQGKTGEAPAPDIVKINNSWLPRYEDLLSPMPENIMSAAEYSQTFYSTCVEDFTGSDGQIYSVPIGIDGLALFYNKELLSQEGVSEPPSDWDGVIELAQRLTKKDNTGRITQAGLAAGTENNVSHSADILSFLLLQNNIEVSSMQSGVLTVDLDNRQASSALTFYRSFSQTHQVWSSELPLDLDMFFRGELAMLFAPSWRVFDIIEAAPAIEFDVVPAPRLEANEPIYYAMYWGEAVSISSQHKEEAWKFIKFLSEQESLQKLYSSSSSIRAFGQPYPRVDLAAEIQDSRYVAPIIEMAPDMKSWKMSQNPTVEEYINLGIAENDLKLTQQRINEFLENL